MLKCASVYTYEIDDPEIAFAEIKTQLDQRIELLEHSVGIIVCHPEFITSGVLMQICGRLPFDLAGVTTSSQAVNGEAGELVLTVFVMTSDDAMFRTGVTEGLEEDIDTAVKAAFDKATQGIDELPKLAIIFPPFILKNAGDLYVNACQRIIPNTPLFGGVAIDDTLTFNESEAVFNNESYKTEMSFILCYGNINPRFVIGTFPEDKVMPYKGEITKSNGNIVHEINGINAHQYFESIGFVSNGVLKENYIFVPFVIDQKKRADYDGIPVMRRLASFKEDGTANFRGYVDEGSTFTMLKCGVEDVLKTTRQWIERLNDLSGVNGILLFSCIVRRMMIMCVNPLGELEIARDTISSDIPFMMNYVCGEICPTLVKDEIPTNRFHNYSLVMLII
ncbi:MAG: FIST C-terminal domain-containing protein [Synergistaceae bacterium]|nr:FIST C-terminal domain-containing protein [Synergistaceae bacterium]